MWLGPFLYATLRHVLPLLAQLTRVHYRPLPHALVRGARLSTNPKLFPPHFRYLHSKGVDFTRRNNGGNDPLNHAVAYGRRDIAAWLLGAGGGGGGGETPSPSNDAGDGAAGRESGVEELRGSAALAAGPAAPEGGRRRRDDPQLLDLARLTGDEKMQAFLLEGKRNETEIDAYVFSIEADAIL